MEDRSREDPPTLSQANLARYLLQQGLVDARSIVDGDFAIRDASSRNRNFMVERATNPSYLVKQGLGAVGAATIAREAAAYRLLTDGGRRLDSFLPRLVAYDAERAVLVLELVRGARDLRSYHLSTGRFSVTLAGATGAALGCLHSLPPHAPSDRALPDQAPWVLSIHRPDLRVLRETSPAGLELVKMVQRTPDLCQRLDDLHARWQPDRLIHHDVKWDNLIVFRSPGSRRTTRLKLVDWEGASYGDPCWDIGSAFSHYLSLWLLSIPITGNAAPDRFPELARFPLERMHPALRTCWRSYAGRMRLRPPEVNRRLVRAIEFAGARLIQTAFEAAQASDQLSGHLLLHLQVGLNILERPQPAAVQLLGIPFGEPA